MIRRWCGGTEGELRRLGRRGGQLAPRVADEGHLVEVHAELCHFKSLPQASWHASCCHSVTGFPGSVWLQVSVRLLRDDGPKTVLRGGWEMAKNQGKKSQALAKTSAKQPEASPIHSRQHIRKFHGEPSWLSAIACRMNTAKSIID